MCIKYEASGEKVRPKPPNELEEARQIAKETYRKARASKEELEQRMSVLLPTKSPDKEDS
ncbi:MAG: hypothetical protein OXU66_05355 [Gammaproteobacteria bacterium]|nr:hypothetical protein [Gammaproteobacteria bacterium]MDD9958350.1 hypothetical protein [Gammaproteobacteria bacterium]